LSDKVGKSSEFFLQSGPSRFFFFFFFVFFFFFFFFCFMAAEEAPVPFWQLDAFGAAPCTGNPAAVLLLRGPLDSDADYLRISSENNLNETAFVWPLRRSELLGARAGGDNDDDKDTAADTGDEDASFFIRWFTPTIEVNLCGHGTLAAGAALYLAGAVPTTVGIAFQTREKGVLRASLLAPPTTTAPLGTAPRLTLAFPAAAPDQVPLPGDPACPGYLPGLLAALFAGRVGSEDAPDDTTNTNTNNNTNNTASEWVESVHHSRGTRKVLVVLRTGAESEQVLRSLRPTMSDLMAVPSTGGDGEVWGVSVTISGYACQFFVFLFKIVSENTKKKKKKKISPNLKTTPSWHPYTAHTSRIGLWISHRATGVRGTVLTRIP
jgi:hypothetical protein